MCPEKLKNQNQVMTRRDARPQRGFTIISAIFLVVVLAALGAMMVTFSTSQQTTSVQDIQGSRAYHAARAGVEFGVYQITRNGVPVCNANTPLALGGSLAGFAVAVQCTAFPGGGATYAENGATSQVFQITSTASIGNAGSADRVERQLTVTVEAPPPP
jgi:MSHA biogenesis protein MshP